MTTRSISIKRPASAWNSVNGVTCAIEAVIRSPDLIFATASSGVTSLAPSCSRQFGVIFTAEAIWIGLLVIRTGSLGGSYQTSTKPGNAAPRRRRHGAKQAGTRSNSAASRAGRLAETGECAAQRSVGNLDQSLKRPIQFQDQEN